MMKELKNCPFTGEKPRIDVWTPEDGHHRDYGRGAWIVTIMSSCVDMEGSSLDSEEDAYSNAIKAWNTRATTKGEAELLKALEDARCVLADYCGKDKEGDLGRFKRLYEHYPDGKPMPIGHASRGVLRIDEALSNHKQQEAKNA